MELWDASKVTICKQAAAKVRFKVAPWHYYHIDGTKTMCQMGLGLGTYTWPSSDDKARCHSGFRSAFPPNWMTNRNWMTPNIKISGIFMNPV